MARAYNPYTGTSAATHQGSNAYSSWGQSVVSNGNKSAYTQHYSNANGHCRNSSRAQRAEPPLVLRPSTGIPAWRKPPAATCMPRTTATFTRIPVKGGNHTTTATGTRSIAQRTLRHKGQSYRNSGARTKRGPSNAPRVRSTPTKSASKSAVPAASDVDQDFQDRNRGEFQSQRFDSFQRGGGGWGGFERGGGAALVALAAGDARA